MPEAMGMKPLVLLCMLQVVRGTVFAAQRAAKQ